MNVYDFDNTIYDGESAVDFYFFLIRNNIRLAGMLPKLIKLIAEYKLCRISNEKLIQSGEKYIARILSSCKDLEMKKNEFWRRNRGKIKKFYLENKRNDDVIISANCDFLIADICAELGVGAVLASEIDRETGKIKHMCFGENKVKIFRERYPNAVIDEFYTDSMNDAPMFALAKRVFLVKGENVEEIKL